MLNLSHSLVLFWIVAWKVFDLLVGRNEVNLVLLANDFACKLGLVILLANVPRLVVEKPV